MSLKVIFQCFLPFLPSPCIFPFCGCTCAACFGFKHLYMTLSHLTLRQPNSLYVSRRTPSWASCIFSTFYSPSRLPFPQPSSSSSFHDKEEGKNVGVFVIIIWEWKFFCLWTWNDISRRHSADLNSVPAAGASKALHRPKESNSPYLIHTIPWALVQLIPEVTHWAPALLCSWPIMVLPTILGIAQLRIWSVILLNFSPALNTMDHLFLLETFCFSSGASLKSLVILSQFPFWTC